MRTFIFYMVAIALLSGCHTYNKDVIRIEEQGSFAVGGTVLTDSLGHNYHGDHFPQKSSLYIRIPHS